MTDSHKLMEADQQALLHTAATRLKQAVPLMLKHRIPTTPTNYALWYTYVGEQQPALNAAMDKVLAEHRTCPPSNSELLYREHLGDSMAVDLCAMRRNLDAMVTELSQSLKDTHTDASQFQSRIDSNFSKLEQLEREEFTLDKMLELVRNMAKESDAIRTSTSYFTRQLNKAQQEIEALKVRLAASEKDILFDALTGCLNRRAFDADLRATLEQAPEGTCLVLCDIDHFKIFNDTYGHQLGDQVLKAVAKRLMEGCRDGAKVYRCGGEEFAILIPARDQAIARQLAEVLRRGLEKLSLKDRKSGNTINNVTASFGVSSWREGMSLMELIDAADIQLYDAKRLGRNRVMPMAG
ncbi:GGDEF domain-containing protein [Shewanella sedimentimangrovi]|nr:GGDEF domain-containing protein [Shewanella sedimentimangrovi]